ncbi:MAG: hypothetical protein MUC97_06760 [Bernardetiaceae bacterium]|jgi:hypothetical protein|nr:hypothetical protein [Bernardetiaceae bacterium]
MKKLNLVFALLLLFGCSAQVANTDESRETTEVPTVVETSPVQLSDDIVAGIMQSIPSPIETSLLIKETGAAYSVSNLNDPTIVTTYNDSYRQALNLGVYSTDLGFANLYDKNQDVLNFLNSVKTLADKLNIGQFFDYKTIKELASSSGNVEKLLQLTQQNFERINSHLNDQKRENLSILILTGGWTEALYLTTLVHQKTKNKKLKEKIGEQKVALDQILLVLDFYKNKPNFPSLIADLKELQKVYNRVEIKTISTGKPVTKEVNGELVVEDATVSQINISDADVDLITSLTKSIRSKIIK